MSRSSARAAEEEAVPTPGAHDARNERDELGEPKHYERTLARLRSLPATFSIEQLCTLADYDPAKARDKAYRWMRAGLIRSAGPRAGYYANLVAAPQLQHSNDWLGRAVLHLYPSAVIVGPSVLNWEGWTTQHPHYIYVAVLAPANRATVDGFEISARSQRWFRRVHGHIVPGDTVGLETAAQPGSLVGTGSLRMLKPAMALADMFSREESWHPDVDDLEIPPEHHDEVLQAFAALGVEVPPELLEALQAPVGEQGYEGEDAEDGEQHRGEVWRG